MVLGAGRRWMRDETGLALKTVVVVGGWPKATRTRHREGRGPVATSPTIRLVPPGEFESPNS
jgi:hypothetical protein